MIVQAIEKLVERKDLTYAEAEGSMAEIMDGTATQAQVAGYLVALRMKGETIEEIAASASAMRAKCVPIDIPPTVLEIVGTGGDKSYSFNISTASAFVLAGGGVRVAKHGNKSVSSKCGAADVLEALGANLKTSPEQAKKVFERCGFVFLHAQVYHPAMRFAAPVRGQLGIRTLFNILGPLANPARAEYQLLGVYDRALARPLCEVLVKLGAKRVMVVHGEDGLDEASCSGRTFCVEYREGEYFEYYLTPADLGVAEHDKGEIVGGYPAENAAILRKVMNGEKSAYRDAVVANSGLCFYLTGKAKNVLDGARMAEDVIDSGKAKAVLERYIRATAEV